MGCRECAKHVEHLHPDALWRVDMDYARAAYLQLGSIYGKFRYHGSYGSRTIQQFNGFKPFQMPPGQVG